MILWNPLSPSAKLFIKKKRAVLARTHPAKRHQKVLEILKNLSQKVLEPPEASRAAVAEGIEWTA
jgi:hypothetical protein